MGSPVVDVRHLALVRAIAEEGSVTRAASRLHVSQPALSHALAEIESRLGTPLFTRAGRMTPTPAGERVLSTATRVLDELSALERALVGEPAVTPVRVSTSCYTVYPWLPPVLGELRRGGHPVDLRIVLAATRAVVPALVAGEIDLGVTTDPPARRGLVASALFEDEIVAVLSPTHRLASRKRIEPADLAGERVLVYDAPLPSLDVWRRFLRPARVRPEEIAHLPLTEAIAELARAGQGIGFLARWAVEAHVARGEVLARPLGRSGLRRQWSGVRRRDDAKAAAIDRVIASIRRHAPVAPR